MFCDEENSAVSVASAIKCESCSGTTAGSFRICAACSALLAQCEICRKPVDTSFLSADVREMIASAQEDFETIVTFATRTFDFGIAPFRADYDERERAVEEYSAFLEQLRLSKAISPDGTDEAGDKKLQDLMNNLRVVETRFQELHQPFFGTLYRTRNETIQKALSRRDHSVRRLLWLSTLPAQRGPELPPTIRCHPELGKQALSLLELAIAALAEFEKTVEYGFFSVHFTDEERAGDLAKHARDLIETATATPKTNLWLSDAFDSCGREYIDLPEFFKQKRRGKRFFKKVLKQFKGKLDDMRRFCVEELAQADADSERKVLREVVAELDEFSL